MKRKVWTVWRVLRVTFVRILRSTSRNVSQCPRGGANCLTALNAFICKINISYEVPPHSHIQSARSTIENQIKHNISQYTHIGLYSWSFTSSSVDLLDTINSRRELFSKQVTYMMQPFIVSLELMVNPKNLVWIILNNLLLMIFVM